MVQGIECHFWKPCAGLGLTAGKERWSECFLPIYSQGETTGSIQQPSRNWNSVSHHDWESSSSRPATPGQHPHPSPMRPWSWGLSHDPQRLWDSTCHMAVNTLVWEPALTANDVWPGLPFFGFFIVVVIVFWAKWSGTEERGGSYKQCLGFTLAFALRDHS